MIVFMSSITNQWIAFSQKQIEILSTQRLFKAFKLSPCAFRILAEV